MYEMHVLMYQRITWMCSCIQIYDVHLYVCMYIYIHANDVDVLMYTNV